MISWLGSSKEEGPQVGGTHLLPVTQGYRRFRRAVKQNVDRNLTEIGAGGPRALLVSFGLNGAPSLL